MESGRKGRERGREGERKAIDNEDNNKKSLHLGRSKSGITMNKMVTRTCGRAKRASQSFARKVD